MCICFIIVLVLCREIFGLDQTGVKVFEVVPEKPEHQKVLEVLHSTSGFDFWSGSRVLKHPSVIMVKPNVMDKFQKIMKTKKLSHREIINDVGGLFGKKPGASCCEPINESKFLDQYNSYKSIKTFLRNIEKDYPNKVDLFRIGRTMEGRDILAVKISTAGGEQQSNRPAIVIDAGIHAREWIGPATALYIINQLVEVCDNRYMISSVDWYLIPLLNPDGYEYSMTVDRLWRKNRTRGRACAGVDPNRNFNFRWMQGGSSADECSETFAGKTPFSERESKALRDFILEHRDNIKLYITLHSFGKFILYPWNYSPEPPDDVAELHKLANNVSDAVEAVYGTKYTVGASNKMLYQASGNSEDWVKGVAGVDLSFAIELPGGGENGFDVPEEKINKVGNETFAGLKVFWKHVAKKFVNRNWGIILKQ